MPVYKPGTLRVGAVLGCAALIAGCCWIALLWIPQSWHDLDDATVRLRIFRWHGYDPDYISAVVAFGTILVTLVALFAFCLWLCWLTARHWQTLGHGTDAPPPRE